MTGSAGAAVPPPARAPETPILTSTGPLADEDAVAALNRARRVVARLSPTWVHSLQDALAIDAAARTGALNAPTVQAIATFQRDTMHAALTGDLDDATLAALQTAFPALAGATTLTASATTTRWADDAAISRERRNGTFLGAPVVDAHAILLDRLAAGEAYLLQRFPGETPERIRAMLGIRTEGQDFYRVARGGGSYHSRGWAIDINYTSNPWVGGQAAGAGPHGRFEDMSRGVIDTKDIVFFLSVVVGCLFISTQIITSRRWR